MAYDAHRAIRIRPILQRRLLTLYLLQLLASHLKILLRIHINWKDLLVELLVLFDVNILLGVRGIFVKLIEVLN